MIQTASYIVLQHLMCQGKVFFSTMQVGVEVQAAEAMEKECKPLSLQHAAQCEEIRQQN